MTVKDLLEVLLKTEELNGMFRERIKGLESRIEDLEAQLQGSTSPRSRRRVINHNFKVINGGCR
jgi:BMFP domain-containing protein YqiC